MPKAPPRPSRTLLRSCFRQKADCWVGEGLGPGDSTSWRTRLRGCVGSERIVGRAIPCSCFRQKADRWVGEDRGPFGSTSWRWRTGVPACQRCPCFQHGRCKPPADLQREMPAPTLDRDSVARLLVLKETHAPALYPQLSPNHFPAHRQIGSRFPNSSPVTAKTAVAFQTVPRSPPKRQRLSKQFPGHR